VLKVLVLPGLVGIGTTLIGLPTDSRLALVLMSGMPTAFAGLILAEEYDLDRELIASSIVMTSVLLLLIIPLWIILFNRTYS
jgi:malate permease and related proteins